MTSHIKKGHNIYNGVEGPEYNVLSYTWGYYQDFDPTSTTQVLPVHGVDWKIPRIKEDHFTASSFQRAIKRAAQGVFRSCEWLWVDIACIPQEHEGETIESIALGQEIGRQVEIFQRAQEAFAWLSSLKTADFTGCLETVDSHLAIMNQHTLVFPSVQVAKHFLDELDQCSRSFEAWMERVLGHPWLQSLWTLQEMILRPDAYIMFDDGFLFLDQSEQYQARPWNFSRVLADVSALEMILTDRHMTDLTKSAEALVTGSDAIIGLQTSKNYHTMITQRLQRLLDLEEDLRFHQGKMRFLNFIRWRTSSELSW
ncbi:hypothetical protein SLS58_008239 [Diplodia intermedia]|uniref:Heterokaryon incompatibility domain-containing protein n=1 Tax=Diplodia intermedia TaxID=856260 RepID=A0ABR3TIA7_9PEZI